MPDEPRVWVQVGNIGVSVTEEEGLKTASELMVRKAVAVGSIHDAECGIARSVSEPGGGVCSCEPYLLRNAAIDVKGT